MVVNADDTETTPNDTAPFISEVMEEGSLKHIECIAEKIEEVDALKLEISRLKHEMGIKAIDTDRQINQLMDMF